MNIKKTGKILTVVAATAALIASLVKDKKIKETNEEK